MSAASRRVAGWGVGVVALSIGLGAPVPLFAQSSKDAYLAAVTAEHVYVRAGADVRYYPFGQVHTGDVVKVIGEKSGWARVVTEGPAFEGFFGYIKYPKTESGHVLLQADGTSAVTLVPTDVFAPNLDARLDPGSSWKPVITLSQQRTVGILESTTANGQQVLRVALPPDAQGWIDVTMLRPATPVEIATWEAALAEVEEMGPPAPVQKVHEDLVVPVRQPALGRLTPNVGATIEATDSAATAPVTETASPATVRAQRRSAEARLARIMLDDLEAAYARLLAEPIETAEVLPLQQLYLDLAGRSPGSRPITQYAEVRARQLRLWADVQEQKLDLAELRARARQAAMDAEAARAALDAEAIYTAVGLLEASTLYDGARLPKLLRISDPDTGRTIGYLQPAEEADYAELVGRRIGIVGKREYHGGFRVHVIEPRRIDVLDSED